jgi:hypothetical protein
MSLLAAPEALGPDHTLTACRVNQPFPRMAG